MSINVNNNNDLIDRIGENLDRLISFDINGRGIALELYTAARKLQLYPLTTTAAIALKRVIRPQSPVLFVTGFPSLTWLLKGLVETDGPIGVAYLARILDEAFGVIPMVVTSELYIRVVSAALQGAGLIVSDMPTAVRSKIERDTASVAGVIPFTSDRVQGEMAAKDLLLKIQPAVIISIEAPGPARDGKYHTMKGRVIPDELVVNGGALFKAASELGILTIGIGDGGNELGTGQIGETTRKVVPNGEHIACIVPSDITVMASISNWGAYAVGASIAALVNKPNLLLEIDVETIIRRAVDSGAVDGVINRPLYSEDRVPMLQTKNALSLMHSMIKQTLLNG
ncbi:glutamate cyclase domain-containing protein [Desulfosporosinus sp. OT]|uniref:glutamate cyclase domain-containing protein n=1 Tax=Desulfosporosinus sp. OT TaxID=913865 RepID=UPI000223A392|nr:glutamate cyclase domain-containing protein [Desulfosporosinus sp. OT]EGW35853.1 hypothetical protein DOT_6290 [Desulfosporosinus sp. OT]